MHAGEQAGVDIGEAGGLTGAAEIVADHFGRRIGVGVSADGHEVAGGGIHGEHVGAGGDGLHSAARGVGELGVLRTAILSIEVDTGGIGGPVEVDGIAIVVAGDFAHVAAGEGDYIKVGDGVGLIGMRIAGEGDAFSVR